MYFSEEGKGVNGRVCAKKKKKKKKKGLGLSQERGRVSPWVMKSIVQLQVSQLILIDL